MYQILSIHLAIGNNAAINIGVQVFESLLSGLLDIYQLGELLDDMIIIVRHFEEPLNCFPQQLYHLTSPPAISGTSPSTTFIFQSFRTRVSHCGFDVHFLMTLGFTHLFMCGLAICLSLEKRLFKPFACLLLDFFVFCCQSVRVLCIFSILQPYQINDFSSI